MTPPAVRRRAVVAGAAFLAASAIARPAFAQAASALPSGRLSFFTSAARTTSDGAPSLSMAEYITSVTVRAPDAEGNGVDYGLDLRQAAFTMEGRQPQTSIYDAFAGARLAGGRVLIRGGQMWLTDLGGLGSFTGGVFEYRRGSMKKGAGRVSAGGFFGAEPAPFNLGLTSGIRKYGGYLILDGSGARRNVVGYVRMTDGGLTERSVLTFTNFVPVQSKFFMYQTAEYDLAGPGGQGHGGLTYFMINTHASAGSKADVQGLYHRGRSIDTRTITNDILAGQPIRPAALDGLLFESIGGRVSAQVAKVVRLNAGYTRDRNNRDSAATGRLTFGGFTSNLAGTHLDLTVTESRISRPAGQYNSLYVSVGRQIGRTVYLSGDYASSVSIANVTPAAAVTVVTLPRMHDLTMSAVMMLGRHWSLLATGSRMRDNTTTDLRMMSGVTYRIR